VQPIHQEIPGPGYIRTQGRLAASRALAGAGIKKKDRAKASGAPAPSRPAQKRKPGR